MSNLVVVGSFGLDTLETPFEKAERVLGGSAPYFALAANLYTDVGVVAVIGDDYPQEHIDLLEKKGINLDGLQRAEGESFFCPRIKSYRLSNCQDRSEACYRLQS